MINTIRKAVYKNGYLIITAAWLYTISFIFSNYWNYNSSPDKVKQKLEQRIHHEEAAIASLLNDTAKLTALLFNADDSKVANDLQKTEFGFFIFKQSYTDKPVPLYWNTNKMVVAPTDLQKQDGTSFINSPNGQFISVKKNIRLRKLNYIAIAVLPIRWSYFIQNKYFHTNFAGYPALNEQYQITNNPADFRVLNTKGNYLFSVQLQEGRAFIAYDTITILLRLAAVLLLFFFLHSIAEELVATLSFYKGYGFLVGSVFLFRLITYLVPFPFDYSKLPLFDPSIYASNWLHPSLGDLLVNAVLFYWLLQFFKNYGTKWEGKTSVSVNVFTAGSVFLYTNSAFLIISIIKSLIEDAKISFDVTNFFSLTIYSTIGIIILCFLTLGFFYLSQVLLRILFQYEFNKLKIITCIVLSGFLNMLLFYKAADIPMQLCLIAWLIGYLLLLYYRKADMRLPIIRSSFFIFWVMIFALSIASFVIYQNREVEFEQRKRIAEKLAIQTDPSGENLLYIAATNFDNSFLQKNFSRFQESEYTNKFIKDSLTNQNFSGYLNKYDTRIYTFDSLFHPIFNEDSLNYASIKTIVLNQSKPTDIPDLFTYESSKDGFNYIYQKTVQQGETVLGYLFIVLKSERYKSEALYPELFNQTQDVINDLNGNYAYAIYSNRKIINHFNNYNFPTELSTSKVPVFEFSYRKEGDYTELWYNAGNNRQVVLVRKNTWVIEAITLFAYLFCSFLLIISIFHIGNLLIKSRFRFRPLQQLLRLNIRSQIQATIIFVSVFSFIVIGIATISFFIYRFNTSNEERLSKSIQVMANEFNDQVESLVALDDMPNNPGVIYELERVVAQISDLHNVDINYYDSDGVLLISTQPYIYNKHLLSEQMEPLAFLKLSNQHRIRVIQKESIGSFGYLSIYIPLINNAGVTYGYLNIPYLNSQLELNQEISGFLATLINLNAFIFLLAGAIAFFITSRITASLSLIGSTMQKMNLGAKNEEINWMRDDEIGVLVKEYNTMVRKLEHSVQQLAQNEREGAWREMARQVAHEIKNPLTPMKLSIQYLQRAIQEDAPNVKALSSGMVTTLIEQIDQLAKIAGDFSQFAIIGNVSLERFDIGEVIQSMVHLYMADDRVHIHWHQSAMPCYILADRIQMSRLFTNLIQNGVEAGVALSGNAVIDIKVWLNGDTIQVTIQDQSGGIPDAMKPHIFSPNFTTKTSGTGLGLAICKGIVEKANGKISYHSTDGVGTIFTIVLPYSAV
ncbi:MAG: sensor histidine kinase [Sphingobacteriia bacterium]|nr:MAG: sensor histidine kinase [Sphingobacteriia bacterium]